MADRRQQLFGQIGAIPIGDCIDGYHNCGGGLPGYYGGFYPAGPGSDPYVRGPISSAGGTAPSTTVTVISAPVKVSSRPATQNEANESGEDGGFGFGILITAAVLIGIGLAMPGKGKE